MSYYVRKLDSRFDQLWHITEHTAAQLGVANPKDGVGTYFEAGTGETVWDVLRRQTPWLNSDCPFEQLLLDPGQYYPRIARPLALAEPRIASHVWVPGDNQRTVALAQGQLSVLTAELVRICRSIHPEGPNLKTYGHDSRNLLMLASTEVEAAWRGVLLANGYPAGKRWTTADYAKLADIMRLRDYEVAIPAFPWLVPVKPFGGWTAAGLGPTKSLPWYAAYNGVKHDRDANFREATLENAFVAVSACAVMLTAQFGQAHGLAAPPPAFATVPAAAFFRFVSMPEWPVADLYANKFEGVPDEWTPISHPGLVGPL